MKIPFNSGNLFCLRPIENMSNEKTTPFDLAIKERLQGTANKIIRDDFGGCWLGATDKNDILLISGTLGKEIYSINNHLSNEGKVNLRKQLYEATVMDIYA